MKLVFKLFRPFYFLFVLILFTVFLLIVTPLVVIASFIGPIKGGNLVYTLCYMWTSTVMPFVGLRHQNIFEQIPDSNKAYVFISNHISFIDIPVFFKTVRNRHFRILGKYEMSKIPIFGFLYKNAVIMVDRRSEESRKKSMDSMKNFLSKNISIFICPEGTFNFSSKPLAHFYDGAFKIAIETQTPIQPILLVGTHQVLNYKSIFSLQPGKVKSIFIESFPVNGLTIEDLPLLKQKIMQRMEETLVKYKAEWLL